MKLLQSIFKLFVTQIVTDNHQPDITTVDMMMFLFLSFFLFRYNFYIQADKTIIPEIILFFTC